MTARPAKNPLRRLMLNIETPSQRVNSGARSRYRAGTERWRRSGSAVVTGSERAGTEAIRAASRIPVRASGTRRLASFAARIIVYCLLFTFHSSLFTADDHTR